MSSQQILSPATIYAGTRGTYCRLICCRQDEIFTLHILSSVTIRAKLCYRERERDREREREKERENIFYQIQNTYILSLCLSKCRRTVKM